jgi:hypothetical protein
MWILVCELPFPLSALYLLDVDLLWILMVYEWIGDQYSTLWTVVDLHKINLDVHGLSWIDILNLMDFVAIQWTICGLSWVCKRLLRCTWTIMDLYVEFNGPCCYPMDYLWSVIGLHKTI